MVVFGYKFAFGCIGFQLLVVTVFAQNECCPTSCSSTPTTCPSADGDPHYYQVFTGGQNYTYKCPPLTLYVTNNANCLNIYNGFTKNLNGCVPCQNFPWSSLAGSLEQPACILNDLLYGVPYCDPSYYWHCTSTYGVAELRKCPDGSGFSSGTNIGCIHWGMWNSPV